MLPRLAPLLPAPIPEPRFVGTPSDRFPWLFFGAKLLSGVEPCDAGLADGERQELGAGLGRFLRVLHAQETLELANPGSALPDDPIRRAQMPFRVARTRERIAEVPPGLWHPPPLVAAILADAERLPPTTERVLTHGDLHLRHVLVSGSVLSGVIDWGDVCRSDPAIDLMLVWLLFPPAGPRRFVKAYGPIDPDAGLRARVLALFLGLTLALYARSVGHVSLERESLAGLERALQE